MAFSFELKLAISSELYGAISAGPEQEYIKNQLQQDQIADQLSLKEFVDPFTGSKNTKA